ncbi:unnamed protein product [Caenorhabditis auriculariae]|uniref:Receptor L-domain domain-containing protein n=1 Tax=Caenorhabditis auriculariae TaxID=2777116 RepID=A0A8S1HUU2_9PELO|nr:unnamed protein product [Caenorhabditis auriculariae]
MMWNRVKGSLNVKLLLMIAMMNLFSVVLTESCCQRPMYAYKDGDAVPPECVSVTCTEATIYADGSRGYQGVHSYLFRATKISSLTLIGNVTLFYMDVLKEVVHKGPGPALTLRYANLGEDTFKSLKTIKVDDVTIYCNGSNKLIEIEGKLLDDVLHRLYKVGNKTLEACKLLTTTQPSVPVATQEACVPNSNLQKAVENVEKECSSNDLALYITSLSSGILLILLIASIVFSVQMYRKLRLNQNRIFTIEAPSGIQTADESAPEAQKDRKMAGVDFPIRERKSLP